VECVLDLTCSNVIHYSTLHYITSGRLDQFIKVVISDPTRPRIHVQYIRRQRVHPLDLIPITQSRADYLLYIGGGGYQNHTDGVNAI
jgi:hypothetical protein